MEHDVMPVDHSFSVESADTARQVAEVQAQFVIARKFPRDENRALIRIKKACERKSLAAAAEYTYPRGGESITGPTIRLAEVIAQSWGNISYGLREIGQKDGFSECVAFALDLETNTQVIKAFRVKLERHTKKGVQKLSDPRDIYEQVANYGMRRVRACLLGIIPGDVVEDAQQACLSALRNSTEPVQERIKKLLFAFDKLGVPKDLLERRLGHSADVMTTDQIVEYGRIHNSIRDGISKREDWFELGSTLNSEAAQDINEKLKEKAKKAAEPEVLAKAEA